MSRLQQVTFALCFCALGCQPRAAAPAAAAPAAAAPATATPTASNGLSPSTVVAKLDGKTVTAAELDAKIKGPLTLASIEHLEKVHELRSSALEELINERLLEKQAKSENLTTEALLKRDVDSGLAEPTEDDLKALYQQATQSGRQLPPFEQMRDQIAQYIKGQARTEKLAGFYAKLREKAGVEVTLPAPDVPRLEIDTSGPSRGPANAPVTIVEFSDYECPFCHRAEPTVRQVLEAYKDKVRVVYREFPLPMHANAQKASEAALCALDQNKFWEMHDKLFTTEAIEVDNLKAYAKELGLDSAKFDACLDGSAKKDAVEASLKVGQAVGVTGTPAFIINGRLLSGALPFERFKEVIDAELAAVK